MPDLNNFINIFSNKDWSFTEIPVTEENKDNRAVPYLLESSAKVTLTILEEYHKWLTNNYNLTPKN